MLRMRANREIFLFTTMFPRLPPPLVSKCHSVVICLWAIRTLYSCTNHEMVSDMPFMYSIVTVVIEDELSFVLVTMSVIVLCNEVVIVVVLGKSTIKVFVFVR